MSGLGSVSTSSLQTESPAQLITKLVHATTKDSPALDHKITDLSEKVERFSKLVKDQKVTADSSRARVFHRPLEGYDTRFGELMEEYDSVCITMNTNVIPHELDILEQHPQVSSLIPGLRAIFQLTQTEFLDTNTERLNNVEKIGKKINKLFAKLGTASASMSMTGSMMGSRLFTSNSFMLPQASMSGSLYLPSNTASISSIDSLPPITGLESNPTFQRLHNQFAEVAKRLNLPIQQGYVSSSHPEPTVQAPLPLPRPAPHIVVTPVSTAPSSTLQQPQSTTPSAELPTEPSEKDLSLSVILNDLNALENDLGLAPQPPTSQPLQTPTLREAPSTFSIWLDASLYLPEGNLSSVHEQVISSPIPTSASSSPIPLSAPSAVSFIQLLDDVSSSPFSQTALVPSSTPTSSSSVEPTAASPAALFLANLKIHQKNYAEGLSASVSKRRLEKNYSAAVKKDFAQLPAKLRNAIYGKFLFAHGKDADEAVNQTWVRNNYFKYTETGTLFAAFVDYQLNNS